MVNLTFKIEGSFLRKRLAICVVLVPCMCSLEQLKYRHTLNFQLHKTIVCMTYSYKGSLYASLVHMYSI